MKGYLKALKTINYVWLIIVFLVIFLAAVPAIPGTVLINLPGPDGWTTTEIGGTTNVSGNVSVHNGGFFPFNDFYFIVVLYTENGSKLAQFASQKADLLPGRWTTFPVFFEFNQSVVTSSLVQALLFSKVTYASLVYFNMNYLFDFQVQAGFKGNVSMGPFVKDFQIDRNQTVVKENGTNYVVEIPYSINTTSVLRGNDLYINGTLSNATEQLGNFTTKATLGENFSGNFTLTLTKAAYDHLNTSSDTLYLNCTLAMGEYDWTTNFTVAWTPPASRSISLSTGPTVLGPIEAARAYRMTADIANPSRW
jgi:hypothetical protein